LNFQWLIGPSSIYVAKQQRTTWNHPKKYFFYLQSLFLILYLYKQLLSEIGPKSTHSFQSPSCSIINISIEVYRMLLFCKRFYEHEIKKSFTVYYSLLFVSSLLSYQKTHFVFSNATLFVIASSSMCIVIHTVTGHRSFHTTTLPYIIDALDFKNESCGLSNSVTYISFA
jgi:hypothetical protein